MSPTFNRVTIHDPHLTFQEEARKAQEEAEREMQKAAEDTVVLTTAMDG